MRVTILAVLFGNAFPDRYLDWIREGVEANVTRHDLCFAVLTDRDQVPTPWRRIPFLTRFNSKLKKLEMFRPDVCPGERVVFTDLDNSFVGNLDALFDYRGPLGIRREFLMHGKFCGASDVQSSLVLFEGGGCTYLWDIARSMPDLATRYPIGGGRGDQLFIGHHKREWDALDDLYPDACVSYKRHWRRGSADTSKACVVYHHGKNVKPHELGWQI